MLNTSIKWFFFCIFPIFGCSTQSEQEALQKICELPNTHLTKPIEISSHLGDSIRNTKIRNLLLNLSDSEVLITELTSSHFTPDNCNILQPSISYFCIEIRNQSEGLDEASFEKDDSICGRLSVAVCLGPFVCCR